MNDDEAEAAGGRRRWRPWLAAATALAFSAAPLQALAPQVRMVAMCSGGGPATMLVLLPPSGRAPAQPHKPGGCGHALCARDRDQPGRRPGAC